MNCLLNYPIKALLMGLFLLTVACQKEPAVGVSNANPAFTGTRWQMTSFFLSPAIDFDGNGTLDDNLLPLMAACDTDNAVMFNADGTVTTSEGPLSCTNDPNRNQKTKQWTYNPGSKIITLLDAEKPGSLLTWHVLEATSTALTIETTTVEKDRTFTSTIHWKAI